MYANIDKLENMGLHSLARKAAKISDKANEIFDTYQKTGMIHLETENAIEDDFSFIEEEKERESI